MQRFRLRVHRFAVLQQNLYSRACSYYYYSLRMPYPLPAAAATTTSLNSNEVLCKPLAAVMIYWMNINMQIKYTEADDVVD